MQATDRWQELLDDPDIDAIVIGTWPYMHHPLSLAALKANKHILTEARLVSEFILCIIDAMIFAICWLCYNFRSHGGILQAKVVCKVIIYSLRTLSLASRRMLLRRHNADSSTLALLPNCTELALKQLNQKADACRQ